MPETAPPKTFADLIDLWPSHAALAEDAGCERANQPAVWKHRNNIPPEYWADIVNGADKRDIEGITLETLAVLARNAKKGAAA